uniref:Uncharacterized protein n=1 Tax=Romanomermis culicivorax TaxID=13658 RepID=A0A915I0S0_ROMCU
MGHKDLCLKENQMAMAQIDHQNMNSCRHEAVGTVGKEAESSSQLHSSLVIVFLAGVRSLIKVQFDRFVHFELHLDQNVPNGIDFRMSEEFGADNELILIIMVKNDTFDQMVAEWGSHCDDNGTMSNDGGTISNL